MLRKFNCCIYIQYFAQGWIHLEVVIWPACSSGCSNAVYLYSINAMTPDDQGLLDLLGRYKCEECVPIVIRTRVSRAM